MNEKEIEYKYKKGDLVYWINGADDKVLMINAVIIKGFLKYGTGVFYMLDNSHAAAERELYSNDKEIKNALNDYLIRSKLMRFAK
jgi:hypothetical protein